MDRERPLKILVIILCVIVIALLAAAGIAGYRLLQTHQVRDPLGFSAMDSEGHFVGVSLPANTCVVMGGNFAKVTSRGYNLDTSDPLHVKHITWVDVVLKDGRQATMTWINAIAQPMVIHSDKPLINCK